MANVEWKIKAVYRQLIITKMSKFTAKATSFVATSRFSARGKPYVLKE